LIRCPIVFDYVSQGFEITKVLRSVGAGLLKLFCCATHFKRFFYATPFLDNLDIVVFCSVIALTRNVLDFKHALQ